MLQKKKSGTPELQKKNYINMKHRDKAKKKKEEERARQRERDQARKSARTLYVQGCVCWSVVWYEVRFPSTLYLPPILILLFSRPPLLSLSRSLLPLFSFAKVPGCDRAVGCKDVCIQRPSPAHPTFADARILRCKPRRCADWEDALYPGARTCLVLVLTSI